MATKVNLCIHGHFYQPPRENPWIESIELQESAAPLHDWNERITFECYLPNVRARVLDDQGRVCNIVNNLEKISFNFGPTLIAWLQEKYPDVYRYVLEADAASQKEHNGHGNALAQCYNHMIMPLANRRDKVTQVRWALEDFRYRFRREPEGIWLPETACNEETLEVLVEEKIRFILLEPHQAQAVRAFDAKEWTDVSSGQINPKVAYRCALKKDPEKTIDVFFYDGPISKAVGFEDLLFDSKRFADRLLSAVDSKAKEPQLIHVSSDGETYGHHKPFGDRVLAYLLDSEIPRRGVRIVNYAQFLDENPPQHFVQLKDGENGEGTSWSCAHGVRRWRDHCGCRGMGPGEWNQHWRKPLREALDWLRDGLAPFCEKAGARYLKDIWEARNDYIHVLLNRREEAIAAFFAKHSKQQLSPADRTFCLKLFEIQRHAMLMYTSCGWFFTELSGIETVQILRYAERAIQLAKELDPSAAELEHGFLDRLAQAKSNIPEFGDGRAVYERFVKPAEISLDKILAHYAISSVLDEDQDFDISCFKLGIKNQRKATVGNLTLNFGRVQTLSTITLEESDLVFIVLKFNNFDFRCSVRSFGELPNLAEIEHDLFDSLHNASVVELLRKIDDYFGKEYYSLKDLLVDRRKRVIELLTKESIRGISNSYEKIYEENRGINEVYGMIGLPVPEEIRYAAEYTLNKRLREEVEALISKRFEDGSMDTFYGMVEAAKRTGARIKSEEIAALLCVELTKRTEEAMREFKIEPIVESIKIQKIAQAVGCTLDVMAAQEHVLSLLRKLTNGAKVPVKQAGENVRAVIELARAIHMNQDEIAPKMTIAA